MLLNWKRYLWAEYCWNGSGIGEKDNAEWKRDFL